MSKLWLPHDSDFAAALREPNLLVPGRKPVGKVERNLSNRFGRDLVSAHLFAGSDRDLLHDWTLSTRGASESVEGDHYSTITGGYSQYTAAQALVVDPRDCTLFMAFDVSVWQSWGALVALGTGAHRLEVAVNGAGRLFIQNNNSWTGTYALSLPLNQYAVYVGSFVGSDYHGTLLTDSGLSQDTVLGVVNSPTAQNYTGLVIGSSSSDLVSRSVAGRLYAHGVIDRGLTPTDQAELVRDIYQVVRPANDAPFLVVVGGTSGQSITPDLIGSTIVMHDPVVSGGPVALSPDHVSATTALYDPSVSSGAAPQSILPGSIGTSTILYDPSLSGGASVAMPDFIGPGTAVHDPSLQPGAATIVGEFIAGSAIVYDPALSAVVNAQPDAIGPATVLHEPGLTPGPVSVAPDSIAAVTALYEPTLVIPVTQAADPEFIGNTTAIYSPSISTTGWTQLQAGATTWTDITDPSNAWTEI